MMLGLDEGGWGFMVYFNTSTERMYRLLFTSICKILKVRSPVLLQQHCYSFIATTVLKPVGLLGQP
jgi:hypothetical protein